MLPHCNHRLPHVDLPKKGMRDMGRRRRSRSRRKRRRSSRKTRRQRRGRAHQFLHVGQVVRDRLEELVEGEVGGEGEDVRGGEVADLTKGRRQ